MLLKCRVLAMFRDDDPVWIPSRLIGKQSLALACSQGAQSNIQENIFSTCHSLQKTVNNGKNCVRIGRLFAQLALFWIAIPALDAARCDAPRKACFRELYSFPLQAKACMSRVGCPAISLLCRLQVLGSERAHFLKEDLLWSKIFSNYWY